MKLNSPTWAIAAPSSQAERVGRPKPRPSAAVSRPLPATARTTRTATSPASAASAAGSTSIPTDTKKSTANRSRNGVTSAAAWCDSSDSDTSTPATNAPSASDSPNTALDTKAVSSAVATTASRNSSLEPRRATNEKTRGSSRVPTT